MSKRNRRIREQILDFLITNFNFKNNWSKEIDMDHSTYYHYLNKEDKKILRNHLKNKLINGEHINLRYSLVHNFNNRLAKNLPALNVKIKIENSLKCECSIANKFGKHDFKDLHWIASEMLELEHLFRSLETLIHLNKRSGQYTKKFTNV